MPSVKQVPKRKFQAPGRVNLIGEHTDYNDGFVLPIAIPFRTSVTVTPESARKVRLYSGTLSNRAEFDLDDPHPNPSKHWSDYVRGVAVMIQQKGIRLCGANLEITSNLPPGGGLSSSAAIEVSSALAFLANSGASLDLLEIAQLAQKAENEFVGARCGIMDQFTSCFGRKDRALLLDCRSLQAEYLPLPEKVALVVCNTMVHHSLATNEYNLRRSQCEQAVSILSLVVPGIRALRDVSVQQLEQNAGQLDPLLYRRGRHVVYENQRTLDAAQALQSADLKRFGELMVESHRSLRDDYEVSSPELDLMCEIQTQLPGVYGARMTGGGFGGCTVAIVDSTQVDNFSAEVSRRYREHTGIKCEIYVCTAADGAGEVRADD